ncbi:EutN/CcmL family microcompartment protein [Paludibacterium paludis]|uniref:Ethanolamine utilization protein EutN n=1 Tax=Paludibacterium paludis TaxID=1225769 RepID=A0A918NWK4_9NEIS|nr:EutN/CcmL family microcompartment protein [Paludibacterium paludis]GGY02299.1 ethanolamine utilization protein EutN [Paludibacterium paludis]
MKLGIVVGQVVSTVKHGGLQKDRLLLVEMIMPDGQPAGGTQVAADSLGAGDGEWVLLVAGSSARRMLDEDTPVDLGVVGIVDEVVFRQQVVYHK